MSNFAKVETIMELVQALVDDELHNQASNSDGGAPGHEKQKEMDESILKSRGELRKQLERWLR